MAKAVQVRMLQTVTYGPFPTWPAGSVQRVPTALVAIMVSSGEAEVVDGTETDVSKPLHHDPSPLRYRHA